MTTSTKPASHGVAFAIPSGSEPAQQRRLRSALAARLRRSPLFPPNWLPSLRVARILWRDYAHFRSVLTQQAVDAAGNPLPWYTYPAIEFLTQLDFRDRTVFEYGSGMSTLFWARVAKHVVSVEDNDTWFRTVSERAPANSCVLFEPDLSNFPEVIHRTGDQYDVIVVDGPARGGTRLKCCRAAVRALRDGGVIILDNSDWLPESSRLLREHGLLEVDMTGFAPICGHVQTTSLYFHRAFNVESLTRRQPIAGRGARPDNWERPLIPVAGEAIECEGERFRAVQCARDWRCPTPGGARTFKGFTYLGSDEGRHIAILDLDRNRVLLTRHRPRGAAGETALQRELDRLGGLSWAEFCGFIAEHEWRRYLLERYSVAALS